jgi:hypothetical protein
MPEDVLIIDAFVEGDEQREPLHIRVLSPNRTDQSDYFCLVCAPSLIGQDKKIYGIDQDQAKSLAVGFVKILLKDKRVVDSNGLPVKF